MTFRATTFGTSGDGSVPYNYRIGEHEVTNARYTEFLNGVDPSGVNALAHNNAYMALGDSPLWFPTRV